nr:hypothetical protein [Tanacetum cinerariifolium]
MWPAVPGQGAPSFGRPQGDRVTSRVAARVTFRGLAMAGGRRRTGSPENVGRRTGGRVTPRLVSPLRARRLPGGQLRRFGRSREPGEPCACLLPRWFTYGRPPADRTAVAAAAAARHEGRLTTKEDGAGQVRTAGGGGGVQLAGAVGQGHPSKMWPAVPGQGAPSFGRPQGDRVTS